MEKCKTKLVQKLVTSQNKFTKKFIDKLYKKRIEQEVGQENKAKMKADLEINKKKLNKQTKKDKERLVKTLTNAYCNPGCKGTLFQEDDFDVDTFVKENICKKDPTCDAKKFVKLFKNQRKTFTKNRKRILTDDSFFYAFINKTKKAKLIKDGALSGCALTAL
jgi:septal ring factor EnvC (AmiA/AmiB activator)